MPQGGDAAVPAPTFWSWLADVGRAPGVVETALAMLVVGTAFLFWWRMAALVRDARSRTALSDYLLGVEQALHGDLDGAHRRLSEVVANDPENHFARLMLGKVLAERGEPELAHQQHVVLKTAFGLDSPDNDLMLAQSLLRAGLPREAGDAAQRALQKVPDQAAAWDFLYRARLQSGEFEAASTAGKRLLALLRDGKQRQALAVDLPATLAQAGNERLRAGDAAGAATFLQEARRHDGNAPTVLELAFRLQAQTDGVAATVQALLAAPAATGGDLVPVGPAATPTRKEGLPLVGIGGIPPSRFHCRACQAPLPDRAAQCPRCLAVAPAVVGEPMLVDELASPVLAMDAIDVNDAHLQRLVQRATGAAGDDTVRAKARAELLALRDVAVPAVLRAAWHGHGLDQERAIEVLRAMGPAIAPVLFRASDDLGAERILPLGSRSPAAVVGRVVQGFDRSALPHVEPLFASAKPEHRKILIDFFLGLHDLEQFQLVLERFPPMEILHRLNKAESLVLRRFLQAVPRGHFVAETLLREETFRRDDELLAAIPGHPDREVLVAVMRARGPSRASLEVLVAGLATVELADVAELVLGELGPRALDHVLAAFADPEQGERERRALQRVLVRYGAPAAAAVVDGFGPEPTASDDALRAILVGIGEAAVPVLQSAYEKSGWLEKVSLGLISRHTNRRVQIILALRAIGSPLALASLQAFAASEGDANLRLRLTQALHGGAADGGRDG
ncbi:MAG: hypothetical protein JNK15_25795 [Planctomycetes bacterium]|nr:hypothetical protein [Planctomycetota bacterium]